MVFNGVALCIKLVTLFKVYPVQSAVCVCIMQWFWPTLSQKCDAIVNSLNSVYEKIPFSGRLLPFHNSALPVNHRQLALLERAE